MNDNEKNDEIDAASAEDLWADAFAEQGETESSEETAQSHNDKDPFGQLEQNSAPQHSKDLDLIMDIPVKMTVQLGKTKMAIKDLLNLSQGSVVPLDGLAGEPLDILINGYLIAQGEVVVVDDKYGIRITDIITPSERMRRLNKS
ncbi:flagellar motor switch protein FliN [Thorsellia kenyensis]|uniref:Flagellar motor switch protein FliN n=1 Tax=Thorsellia kenyensis TaxID=1549888 RepID=A0ABV6CFI7_9GAMM